MKCVITVICKEKISFTLLFNVFFAANGSFIRRTKTAEIKKEEPDRIPLS